VELITVDGKQITDAMALFLEPNAIVRLHGVGRRDVVETPGFDRFTRATAHINLEGLVLDREVRDLRDQFVTSNYAKVPYNKSLKESIMASTENNVNQQIRCRVYSTRHHHVLGRCSETEIFVGSRRRIR
jgi:argininosuccinate synthase